jgi:hypothetical protein
MNGHWNVSYCTKKDNFELPGAAVPVERVAMRQSQPSLPTNRAFVVQFRPDPPEGPPQYVGRAEHLASGQVARFQSLEELLAFMIRVLTDVQAQSDPP